MKLFLAILLIALPINALALTGSWDAPVPDVDGYIIWEVTDTGKAEVATAPQEATSVIFDADFVGMECKTYFITSYIGEGDSRILSLPSNTALACPDITVPEIKARPGQVINLNISFN